MRSILQLSVRDGAALTQAENIVNRVRANLTINPEKNLKEAIALLISVQSCERVLDLWKCISHQYLKKTSILNHKEKAFQCLVFADSKYGSQMSLEMISKLHLKDPTLERYGEFIFKSLNTLQKADLVARLYLARLLHRRGAHGDYVKAFTLFDDLHRRGCSRATYSLAVMRSKGHGVEIDLPMAIMYLEQAAAKNHMAATEDLITFSETGSGKASFALYKITKKGGYQKEALRYLHRAVAQGSREAKFHMDVINPESMMPAHCSFSSGGV